MARPKIAVSIGDLNGIGFEIALESHGEVIEKCEPIYFISKKMANKCASMLGKNLPSGFECFEIDDEFEIGCGTISKEGGASSYTSFETAMRFCADKQSSALVTMPISKEAWKMAGIKYVGHTDVLRDFFKTDAIMALGYEQMMVALYTDHIPLRDVCEQMDREKICSFLKLLKSSTNLQNAAVLGVNPHAGDGGALGFEDEEIACAIREANEFFGEQIFFGPMVPDAIFNPIRRKNYNWFVAMYHDQGLAPLKALYFEESINVSLGLPIIRTSVDHGTAFDIAYKNANPSNKSYLNAIKFALDAI